MSTDTVRAQDILLLFDREWCSKTTESIAEEIGATPEAAARALRTMYGHDEVARHVDMAGRTWWSAEVGPRLSREVLLELTDTADSENSALLSGL